MFRTLKLTIALIIITLSHSVNAQKLNIHWNNCLELEGLRPLGGEYTVTIKDAYYCLTVDDKTYSSRPSYYLVKLDETLKLLKKVEIPVKQNGIELFLVGFTANDNNITVLFKFYETRQHFTLVKTSFNSNLSNPLQLEKIEDLPTQADFIPYHSFSINYNTENRDVIIAKTPRDAYPDFSKLIISEYDNSFSEKKWSTTINLEKYSADYAMKAFKYTDNKDIVFLMKAKLKAFSKIKNNMLLCKYSKKGGLKVHELHFEKEENTFNFSLYIDDKTNDIYVYGILDEDKTKECNMFVKKCSLENLEEQKSFTLNLGNSKENGFQSDGLYLSNLIIRVFEKNNNGEFTFMADMFNGYSASQSNPISGNILFLKFKENGDIIKKAIIARKQQIGTYKTFASFLYSKNDSIVKILFYDNEKNANIIEFNSKLKIKSAKDNIEEQLYMVTIDEHNNITKQKVEKENRGKLPTNNIYKNFEFSTITALPTNGVYFVKDGMNIGIMTVVDIADPDE